MKKPTSLLTVTSILFALLSIDATGAGATSHTVEAGCAVTAKPPASTNDNVQGFGSVRCAKRHTAIIFLELQLFDHGKWQYYGEYLNPETLRAGRTRSFKTTPSQCLGNPGDKYRSRMTVKIPHHHIRTESSAIEVACPS
jgi:hypothetical protein